MLAEYVEDTCILVGKVLLHRVADIHATLTEAELSTHLRIDTDIQLSDVDMLDNLLVKVEGIVHFLLGRTVDVIVSLHTDTVDGYSSLLHGFHHVEDALALHRIALVIVVVEKQCLRVSLVGKLESLGDELITAELVHRTLTVGVNGR